MVGLETSDCLAFAALVLAAGGAWSWAAALVCDLVLQAGAVGGDVCWWGQDASFAGGHRH